MRGPPDLIGVPLGSYIDQGASYGVRFECLACMDSFDAPLLDVIARLKATGRGDDTTGIKAVARLASHPCGRCGSMRWETRPALKPRPPRGLAARAGRASVATMTDDEIERKAKAEYEASAESGLQLPWAEIPETRRAMWREIVQGNAGAAED